LIKLTETCWLFALNILAIPLKWKLQLVEYLLQQFLKGFCCVGCLGVFSLFGIILGFVQGILTWTFGEPKKQERAPISKRE